MAENNEDFLTQCLLTMKGTLESDAYFSPTASAPIPAVDAIVMVVAAPASAVAYAVIAALAHLKSD